MIHKMPNIAAKCEDSVRKCKRALKDMNKLLRTSQIENFWLRWNLQEMGPRFSQSEHNATFMPTGVRTPLSRATTAAYTPRPRMFTPTSGNVKSTTPSTATARPRSSPPACTRLQGPTSCQASRGYDKLKRQPHHFIRSHAVRESTPIHRTFTFTAPMSTPMKSSFQSSTNSSFQNYARRLPAVRMAGTKQTARKVRDDRQRGRSHQPDRDWRRDCSNTPPRRVRPRSPSPERLECVLCSDQLSKTKS